MDISSTILDRYEKRDKAPKHQKAACVNEIVRVLGENATYNYAYWLRKVGNATYSDILSILKEADKLPKKYSKGGFVTNQLKQYAVPISKPKRPRTDGRGTKPATRGRKVHSKDIREVDDSKERLEP